MLPMYWPFLTSQEASAHSIWVKKGKEQFSFFFDCVVFSATEDLSKVVTFVEKNKVKESAAGLLVCSFVEHESMETAAPGECKLSDGGSHRGVKRPCDSHSDGSFPLQGPTILPEPLPRAQKQSCCLTLVQPHTCTRAHTHGRTGLSW